MATGQHQDIARNTYKRTRSSVQIPTPEKKIPQAHYQRHKEIKRESETGSEEKNEGRSETKRLILCHHHPQRSRRHLLQLFKTIRAYPEAAKDTAMPDLLVHFPASHARSCAPVVVGRRHRAVRLVALVVCCCQRGDYQGVRHWGRPWSMRGAWGISPVALTPGVCACAVLLRAVGIRRRNHRRLQLGLGLRSVLSERQWWWLSTVPLSGWWLLPLR